MISRQYLQQSPDFDNPWSAEDNRRMTSLDARDDYVP